MGDRSGTGSEREVSAAMRLGLGLSGEPLAVAAAVLALPPWSGRTPVELRIDRRSSRPRVDWQTAVAQAQREVAVTFSQDPFEYVLADGGRVVTAAAACARDVGMVMMMLEEVPFTVASFLSIHPDWRARTPAYDSPGFGDGHFPLGWGCAFKGAGHEQLVSRRWLEHGPWRLLRGAGDLSVVQFHDLAADSERALQQARPGHQRMGNTPEGGFLQTGYVYSHDINGFYDAGERLLKFVVHDRDVPPLEMRDAAAALRLQALGPDKPLQRLAFVFLEPDRAQTHLEALWLYGLECWTIIMGNETRLDADYSPLRRVPEWVSALDGG
jgi:hypothetical protein